MKAKYDAERDLHSTKLQYTVLRPGLLTDEAAAGAEVGVTQMGKTSRELVALAVWEVLAQDGTIGLTLDVMDGGGQLEEEVAKAVMEKADAWTG